MPWIGSRETPGNSILRPATSPADIASHSHPGEAVSVSTRHTSPELNNNNNNIFPGRTVMALRESPAQTERPLIFDANTNSLIHTMAEHNTTSPEAGPSSRYSSMSPVPHSNPHSATSNASSPLSACAPPPLFFHQAAGSVTPAPLREAPEASGPAVDGALSNDIIGGGSAPSASFATSPTTTRPICSFYHARRPLLPSSSSAQRGHHDLNSSFNHNSEGNIKPTHQFRIRHQSAFSSPATCGFNLSSDRTILTSPRDHDTTMSAPSHSRSQSHGTMSSGGNSGPLGNNNNNNNNNNTGPVIDKGKAKEDVTKIPASSIEATAAVFTTPKLTEEDLAKLGGAPATKPFRGFGGFYTPSLSKFTHISLFERRQFCCLRPIGGIYMCILFLGACSCF